MERLLRPSLDRWVLLALVALSMVAEIVRWRTARLADEPEFVLPAYAVAFTVNVILGVAVGYVLYGAVLLVLVLAQRARSRLRGHDL